MVLVLVLVIVMMMRWHGGEGGEARRLSLIGWRRRRKSKRRCSLEHILWAEFGTVVCSAFVKYSTQNPVLLRNQQKLDLISKN